MEAWQSPVECAALETRYAFPASEVQILPPPPRNKFSLKTYYVAGAFNFGKKLLRLAVVINFPKL